MLRSLRAQAAFLTSKTNTAMEYLQSFQQYCLYYKPHAKGCIENMQYKQTLLRYQYHFKATHPSLKMQKEEIFHSYDSQLPGSACQAKESDIACYCESGEEVWV